MLKRKAMESSRNARRRVESATAILLEGARRIGKSALLEAFDKERYERSRSESTPTPASCTAAATTSA